MVNKEIDLTLESLFAGDDDPSLLFNRGELNLILLAMEGAYNRIFENGWNNDSIHDIFMNSYKTLFGMYKDDCYFEYDPYATVFGVFHDICDRCGKNIHLANKGQCTTLCVDCDDVLVRTGFGLPEHSIEKLMVKTEIINNLEIG